MRSVVRTAAVFALMVVPTVSSAAGISVDAGLTPPEDRWIVRTQVRYMSRGDDPDRNMQQYMFPLVVAYGVRSGLTVVVRQAAIRREMTMPGSTEASSGLGDTFLFAKYKAYRFNSRRVTFGVAPTLGIEFPTGKTGFTSDTWDMNAGLYASVTTRTWSTDVNVAYTWIDVGGDADVAPGDEFSFDAAVAYQFILDRNGRVTTSPVLEASYRSFRPDRFDGNDRPNTGETVLYVSPGAKLSTSTVIVEGLVRVPVRNEREGSQLKRNTEGLIGVRILF